MIKTNNASYKGRATIIHAFFMLLLVSRVYACDADASAMTSGDGSL